MNNLNPNRRNPLNRTLRRAVLAGDMLAVVLESLSPEQLGDLAGAAGPVLAAWEQSKADLRGHMQPSIGQQAFIGWTDGEEVRHA